MSEFLDSIFPFGAFFLLTIIIGVIYCVVEKVSIFLYETINELIFPSPKLPEEEANRIFKEAADFVHSKHRPWMYDDTFAEYLALIHERSEQKWQQLYGNEK